MRLSSRILALALAAAALAASLTQCAPAGEQGEFFSIPSAGWAYGDTLAWPAACDSACVDTADIAIAVRNTNAYEYSNLWVELTWAQGDSAQRVDTIDLRLADDYGHWHGKGIGVGYQMVDTVARRVAIDRSKPVTLRHIMRVDTLRGIEQVGVIVYQ